MPYNLYVLIIINILLVLAQPINSFGQSFQWAKKMGSVSWDEGTSIAIDYNSNVYVVGLFGGTVDFDPGTSIFNLTSVGEKDAFILKLDSNGNFMWAKQYGDSASIGEKSSIGIDALGNLYTTNSFVGTVDFDPGPDSFPLTSMGWDRDIFIQKLDENGNFIWAKQISAQASGNPTPVHSNALAIDASGNHYLTGYFDGTVDFDPNPNHTFIMHALTTNSFVLKLDPDGNFVWAKEFESAIPGVGAVGLSIAIDANDNVYSVGTIGGTVDFNPGPDVFNLTTSIPFESEAYLCKLDASGDFVWAKALGPGIGYALVVDESGISYCGNAHSGGSNFLYKFDSLGNLVWTNPLEGINGIRAIALVNGSQIYVAGSCCMDTVDLNPGSGVYSLTGDGSFISQYDTTGLFISAGLLSGTWLQASTTDSQRNFYATGFFENTTDFDIGPATFNLSALHYDVFILKLNSSTTVGIFEHDFMKNIKIYPNPTSGNLTIEFEKEEEYLSLVLRNIMGQELYSKTIRNNSREEIQIIGNEGVYLLEIFDQSNLKAVVKIIKNE